MAEGFPEFGQLPLEIQQIILSQNDVAREDQFPKLSQISNCRTPITAKELDNFLAYRENIE